MASRSGAAATAQPTFPAGQAERFAHAADADSALGHTWQGCHANMLVALKDDMLVNFIANSDYVPLIAQFANLD